MYADNFPLLFQVTEAVEQHLAEKDEQLLGHLHEQGVMMTPCFASGFMSLFTNCLPLDASLRVMDYFMLHKTEAIVSLAKQILKAQRSEILAMTENY